jgi:hypothetical protein
MADGDAGMQQRDTRSRAKIVAGIQLIHSSVSVLSLQNENAGLSLAGSRADTAKSRSWIRPIRLQDLLE